MKFTREFYIPKGSVKVADKATNAVVYVYEQAGVFYAAAFHGKAAKPDWHFRFKTAGEREKRASEHFATWRRVAETKAQRRADAKAKPIAIEAGDILQTCWGYDQTNREFFQVIEVKGCFAILREVAQASEETGFTTGDCVPQSDTFIGEPIRRRINGDGVKIDDCRRAWKWNTAKVAGVAIGPKARWSAYA